MITLDLTNITPERRIPDVGEIWRHMSDQNLFLRVEDGRAKRAFGFSPEADVFVSVVLGNNPGKLVYTISHTQDIYVYGKMEITHDSK